MDGKRYHDIRLVIHIGTEWKLLGWVNGGVATMITLQKQIKYAGDLTAVAVKSVCYLYRRNPQGETGGAGCSIAVFVYRAGQH